MEMMFLGWIFGLSAVSLFFFWKYHCLKRDLYDFTQRLDETIDRMMKEEELKPLSHEKESLWSRTYERLRCLSRVYTRKQEEIAEEQDRLKELVSDISHQIKTPMANIKLYLEMLGEEREPDRKRECLKKMNGQADKLDFLMESMVKMSRLETGVIKIQKSRLPVADTLALAISSVVLKAEKKNIRLDVKYDEGLTLVHDKKWTGEALFNILDNAVKYTDYGGKIHITVRREEFFTKISVQDTGKGILPERQAAVFKRFYREPEIHDSEGIGIGLYLAREIVALQKGYIELESRVGRGSLFKIYLPNRA